MPITVTRARVKEKCGVTDTGSDAAIDALIVELVPVIEERLRPEVVANPDATVTLGATEIVAGEFLSQLARSPGGSDSLSVQGIAIDPPKVDVADPSGLVERGWERLRPYRKREPEIRAAVKREVFWP